MDTLRIIGDFWEQPRLVRQQFALHCRWDGHLSSNRFGKSFIQDSGAMATLADGFKAVAAADGPIVALSKLYNDSLPSVIH